MKLTKTPHNATIVEGFPGFGLVGSIATEFLIEHLKCEQIGSHWFEEIPATIAVHEGNLIKPMNIFYCEEFNLVIIHAISSGSGLEWKITDYIDELAGKLNAKEIVSLEGVGSVQAKDNPKVYYVTNQDAKKEHLKNLKINELKEGILVGVTSALLTKSDKPLTAFFAETHSELPDSMAAAKIVETLNAYLDLHIDPKPLLEQAQKFENKLNTIIKQGATTQDELKRKQMSYVG